MGYTGVRNSARNSWDLGCGNERGVTPMLGIPITGGGPVLGIPEGGVSPILGMPRGVVVTMDGTVVEGFVDVSPIVLVKSGSYCGPAMRLVGDISVGFSDSASESDVK